MAAVLLSSSSQPWAGALSSVLPLRHSGRPGGTWGRVTYTGQTEGEARAPWPQEGDGAIGKASWKQQHSENSAPWSLTHASA